jgi:hypothetical protein
MKKFAFSALIAGIWINASEFLRNELILKQYWLQKYQTLGQSFPSAPVNAALWVVWGFLLAGVIAFLARRQTFVETMLISWIFAFLMMWVVIWNLNVLPVGLLPVAAPWSMGEVAVAVLITRKISGPSAAKQRPERDN